MPLGCPVSAPIHLSEKVYFFTPIVNVGSHEDLVNVISRTEGEELTKCIRESKGDITGF